MRFAFIVFRHHVDDFDDERFHHFHRFRRFRDFDDDRELGDDEFDR